jgi:predicted phosphodiesterase
MIRTLGIIGDVHVEHEALSMVLQYLQLHRPDQIVCAGDLVDGPGDLSRCIELLEAHRVLVVAGNHERWLLSGMDAARSSLPSYTRAESISPNDMRWLHALPKTRTLQTVAGEALLCHGIGADDMACVRKKDGAQQLFHNKALQQIQAHDKFSLMLNGHTHELMVRSMGRLTILNGGTLVRDHNPGFLLADLAKREASFLRIEPDLSISLEKKESW